MLFVGDWAQTSWFHPDCVDTNVLAVIKKPEDICGYRGLKKPHQTMLAEMTKKGGTKRKELEREEEEQKAKKEKKDSAGKEAAEKLWEAKKKVQDTWKPAEQKVR